MTKRRPEPEKVFTVVVHDVRDEDCLIIPIPVPEPEKEEPDPPQE